jgi:DDE superfamily endonuclease
MRLAEHHPEIVLGFEDEVWWSREAQPSLHAWSDGAPLRLNEKQVPARDAEAKALACYGLYLPASNQMLLRFVVGRPLGIITCLFLAWLATYFAAQGKRALFLIWDNASWHISQEVRTWIKAHNRQVKRKGGCRLLICHLPTKSPGLNPIEPKWLHGKRAVAEPQSILPMRELMQRICDYYHCPLDDPITQLLC